MERIKIFFQHNVPSLKDTGMKFMWGCGVLAVIWMEGNKRIFDDYNGAEVEDLLEKVRFWSALWASVLVKFKDYFLLHFSRHKVCGHLSLYVLA